MQKDHRPYPVKKAYLRLQQFYVKRFIRPQLSFLGPHYTFMKPWYVELFGGPIRIGRCANVIATADQRVRLAIWPPKPEQGAITVGDYCLICPGVRISAAAAVTIGDNCMLASGAYITDCDWHGLYNRVETGASRPVTIGANVWIGDRSIICKGVTIGENSIVGAGAVVTRDIAANVVAAGNPARVVKTLDPDARFTTRADWFANPPQLARQIDQIDQLMLAQNNLRHWLRHLLFPRKGD